MLGHLAERQQHYGDQVRIDYEIEALDPRLSLSECPNALEVAIKSQNRNRLNLLISCRSKRPWSLYVPVSVSLYREVVIATTTIARGATISEHQLQLNEQDIAALNSDFYTSIEALAGMEAKRLIRANTVISQHHTAPPVIIKKGESVLITASTGVLTVKLPAEALSDGRLGEQISVRNTQSKRVVKARVTGTGQVEVLM